MLLAEHFFDLFLDAAPWLLGGLVIAGLIHSFVGTETLAKHLGQDDLASTVKAALFGAPLPLCSCSVIPAAMSLKRNGASKSATVSFLVSTPETGADSIAVSYALLGPFMAIIRPIAAVLSAISAGLLTQYFKDAPTPNSETGTKPETVSKPETASENASPKETSSCCASKSCCSSSSKTKETDKQQEDQNSFFQRFMAGQRYAFVDIFNDMAGWLLVGLLLAAATLTWVPEQFLTQWGDGFTAMLVMALVGIPMYICATASTPIAAGLLLSGLSPGAVLVFMLAGPATNMATLGIIKRELGGRAVFTYLTGVLSMAFLSGFATNALVHYFNIDIQAQLAASEHLLPEWLMLGSAMILAALIIHYGKTKLRKQAVI